MISKELQKRILSSIIIIPLTFFFIIKGSYYLIFFLVSLFFLSTAEWFKMSKKNEFKILGGIFLAFTFYTTFHLRNIDLTFFLFILMICISTDLGGYIFGKLFKGPKLIKISPNKTYSGMIGSFFLSVITAYFFNVRYEFNIFDIQSAFKNVNIIFIGLIVSGISQIGDLIISYFKRSSKIKNTGNILPGHGGLLDRIDGMIFVFPSIYLIMKILS